MAESGQSFSLLLWSFSDSDRMLREIRAVSLSDEIFALFCVKLIIVLEQQKAILFLLLFCLAETWSLTRLAPSATNSFHPQISFHCKPFRERRRPLSYSLYLSNPLCGRRRGRRTLKNLCFGYAENRSHQIRHPSLVTGAILCSTRGSPGVRSFRVVGQHQRPRDASSSTAAKISRKIAVGFFQIIFSLVVG